MAAKPPTTAAEISAELHRMIKAGRQNSKRYDELSAQLYALPRQTRPLWQYVTVAGEADQTAAAAEDDDSEDDEEDEEEEDDEEDEEEEEEESSPVASECSEASGSDTEMA